MANVRPIGTPMRIVRFTGYPTAKGVEMPAPRTVTRTTHFFFYPRVFHRSSVGFVSKSPIEVQVFQGHPVRDRELGQLPLIAQGSHVIHAQGLRRIELHQCHALRFPIVMYELSLRSRLMVLVDTVDSRNHSLSVDGSTGSLYLRGYGRCVAPFFLPILS